MSDQIFDQFVKDKLHDHVAPVPGDMWQRIHVRTDQVFDQFIKNKLDDHEARVPDDMWQRIQRHTDDDRKGFFIPRLGVFLLLIGLISAGGFFYFIQSNKNSGDNKDNKNTSLPLTVSAQKDKQGEAAKKDQTNSNTDPTEAKPNTGNSNSAPGKNQSATASISETENPRNSSLQSNTTGKFLLTAATHQKPVLAGFESRKNNSPVNPTAGLISEVEKNKLLLQANHPTEEQQAYIPMLPASLMSKNAPWNMLVLKEFLNSKNGLPIVTCPSVNGLRRNDLYVEGYVSPDFVQKIITGPSSFLQRKDSTEIQQLSFSAGIRISKSITDHVLLKTGLQYSQINETYHERTENERRQVTIITTHTISRPNGDTIIIDTSQFLQIGYRTKTTHNRYRRVDVPVLLSYEIGKGSLKIAATGGVILNVYSFNKGEIVDTAAGGTIKTANIYKNNVGMSAYAGLSILKSVSERMDVFAEPYFKYDLSNNANNNAVFTQKFNTIGVNVGVRYLFKTNRQQNKR